MRLMVPSAVGSVHFGYGIKPDALDQTLGVEFRLLTVARDGSSHPLWQKQLLPMTRRENRGEFYQDIPLPASGITQIQFETLPATSLIYDHSHWSDVRFK
jgi:hypothetical protein